MWEVKYHDTPIEDIRTRNFSRLKHYLEYKSINTDNIKYCCEKPTDDMFVIKAEQNGKYATKCFETKVLESSWEDGQVYIYITALAEIKKVLENDNGRN